MKLSTLIGIAFLCLAGCGKAPEKAAPPVVNKPPTVREMYLKMLETDRLTTYDKPFRDIVNLGPKAIPELREIAQDTSINMHFIAYLMLGRMRDKSQIPFLIAAINPRNSFEVQKHAIGGLDSLIGLGCYAWRDEDPEKVNQRYLNWWKKHEHDYMKWSLPRPYRDKPR